MVNLYKKYPFSIFAVLIIFLLSTVNFSSVGSLPTFKHGDKVVHILMYAALGVVLFYEYQKDDLIKYKVTYFYLILILFPFLYGALIEIIQETFFSPRTADFLDWVADVIGTFIGGGIALLNFLKKENNE